MPTDQDCLIQACRWCEHKATGRGWRRAPSWLPLTAAALQPRFYNVTAPHTLAEVNVFVFVSYPPTGTGL